MPSLLVDILGKMHEIPMQIKVRVNSEIPGSLILKEQNEVFLLCERYGTNKTSDKING